MTEAHYQLVDVFTRNRFGGNQLAVFADGTHVPESYMLTIAQELNLSETTYVLPPQIESNDHAVRIFTPGGELPMAGHPTIGTAFILCRQKSDLPDSGEFQLLLEEQVGVIPVEIKLDKGKPQLITMTQPTPKFSKPIADKELLAQLLSLDESDILDETPTQTVSCGVPYLIIPCKSLAAVQRIKFRLDVWDEVKQKHDPGFVYAYTLETETKSGHVHGRMFAPEAGILEDPATGSANGPLGAYLVHHNIINHGKITEIISEQGYEMGRPSQLYITIKSFQQKITEVKVGGYCIYIGHGSILIP